MRRASLSAPDYESRAVAMPSGRAAATRWPSAATRKPPGEQEGGGVRPERPADTATPPSLPAREAPRASRASDRRAGLRIEHERRHDTVGLAPEADRFARSGFGD